MKMDPLGVVLFAVGAILLYSAVKDKDPRDVVKQALGQAQAKTPTTSAPAPTAPGKGGNAPKAR